MPAAVALWNACGLGRGAVAGLAKEAFDLFVLAQQHFRRDLLTVAVDGPDGRGPNGGGPHIVGWSLGGLTFDHTDTRTGTGVVCGVLVHPDHRRAGLGTRLLAAAADGLRAAGARRVLAGPAPPADPFLMGLYGGITPAGFLDSDAGAAPFLTARGWTPHRRVGVFHRDVADRERPGFPVLAAKRRCEVRVTGTVGDGPRWWATRVGRLDPLRFTLHDRASGDPVATALVIGLEQFGPVWGELAVGLTGLTELGPGTDVHVQALILEVNRRLKQEGVSLLEVHANSGDTPRRTTLTRLGFSEVDAGTVYEAPPAP